jgi:hypothetical protein
MQHESKRKKTEDDVTNQENVESGCPDGAVKVKIEQDDVEARVTKKSRSKANEEIKATKRIKMEVKIEKERFRIAMFDESWDEHCEWEKLTSRFRK